MSFDDALYARDDEMDEFGDSGAYGDSLEEDYEEEVRTCRPLTGADVARKILRAEG